MSHIANDIFLENTYRDFLSSIESGRFDEARVCVERLRANGFERYADDLYEELLAQPLNRFLVSVWRTE